MSIDGPSSLQKVNMFAEDPPTTSARILTASDRVPNRGLASIVVKKLWSCAALRLSSKPSDVQKGASFSKTSDKSSSPAVSSGWKKSNKWKTKGPEILTKILQFLLVFSVLKSSSLCSETIHNDETIHLKCPQLTWWKSTYQLGKDRNHENDTVTQPAKNFGVMWKDWREWKIEVHCGEQLSTATEQKNRSE